MSLIPSPPAPGELVRVRQRRYLVEQTVPPPAEQDSTLVHLSCVDDDAQGQALSVLWEKEVDPEILTAESWDQLAAKGFDPPDLFAAYLHTLRWNCVTATDPKLFQAPFRAGIRIDVYQLEPLRKALLLPRVNLFIADDVGLGKTIEAGLIARELLLRRKVREIVISCPPSMLLQWRDEMDSRFGLAFQILDREYVAHVRRERGYGVNPWTTHPRFLVSSRLLTDEDYTGPLRDWLGELKPGSLLILDEAHHAAPSSGARYAIDSKITRAVRDLAPRFEHRLFLSATPHNGHSNSFSALLELLDPQRFCRGVPVEAKNLEPVMVRRLKDDLRELGEEFPKRMVVQEDIKGLPDDAPELRLSRLLDEYRSLRDQRLKDAPRRVQTASGLLISGLQQRLLSSIEAFARTLRVHRRTVQRQWKASQQDAVKVPEARRLDLLGAGVSSDDDRSMLSEEDLQSEEDAQIEAASAASVGPTAGSSEQIFADEQKLLDEMTEIADAARGLPDAKIRKLLTWISKNMCPAVDPDHKGEGMSWNNTRLIIFTEWDDTKRYIREQLSAALEHTDRAEDRIEVFHGPTPAERREEIKRAFNTDPAKNALRILIATDAAREGLNLQKYCNNLFHFDVPWNPARMEQRNGRIDRKLQPEPEVFCHYFFYHQRPEDRVLQALVRKTETIEKELGSLAQVVEDRLATTLNAGIRHADVDRLEKEIEEADLEAARKATVEEELEETRDRQTELRTQIEGLRNRLSVAKKWIGFEEEDFRSALSCSLRLLGAPPLMSTATKDGELGRFEFPALDRRQGADPTWADTMDVLRAPRRKDQKFWEWRKDSPMRPVVFADPGSMNEEVVQLHLEHRLARRLLGRFIAQGFVHHDLSRACLAQSEDAIPRVVLIGRLALYGMGGTRLHEEIVPVAARWIDPRDRKKPLVPYGRTAETITMSLLEEAMAAKGSDVPGQVGARLQASAPRDVDELLPHLKSRAQEIAEEARLRLEQRAEQEAKAMHEVIESQIRRVTKTAQEADKPQLSFDFSAEEKGQLASNRRHWAKRLDSLQFELETEPDRIRDNYSVKARPRIEPIGLVYLWPVTG